MVYPEKGLFPKIDGSDTWHISLAENVADPTRESANPCDQYNKYANSPILRNLSCLSKEHGIYVVAELIDVKECEVENTCDEHNADYCREREEDCPEDGKFNFNTFVAFIKDGTLVARYYKRYLYFTEDGISTPKVPKNVYFETEFGLFTGDICFDLFFKDAAEGADRPDVTFLSYPSW
ncbi:Biotinidase, partial [Araneus ventricosus]